MVGEMKTCAPWGGLLLRPWDDDWQMWNWQAREDLWKNVAKGAENPKGAAFAALPARLVVSAVIWIDSTAQDVILEMTRLQVEMKGLAPGERAETDVRMEVLCTVENRTLVRTIIFPQDVPAGITPRPEVAGFVPSPLALRLDADGVHVWKEAGDLVAAVCRNGAIVCWETFPEWEGAAFASAWFECLLLQLEAESVLQRNATIHDWCGLAPASSAGRTRRLMPEAERASGPPPAGMNFRLIWQTPAARLEAQNRKGRRRLFTAGLATAALVVACTAAALTYSLYLSWRSGHLRKEQAALSAHVLPLKTAALRWFQVEHAVVPDLFPLEALQLITEALPAEGVKLTLFEMSQDKIQLQGQARSASLATQFFNNLEQRGAERGTLWEMATPTFQPDNTARFVIQGERHASSAQ